MAADQILFLTKTDKQGKDNYSAGTYEIDYLFGLRKLLKTELEYQDRYYSPALAYDYCDELTKIQAKIKGTQDPLSLFDLIRMEGILIRRISMCDAKERSKICTEINRVEQRILVLSNPML
ncbi:hypothetical protein [Paenibacillus taichungensis]